MHSNPASDSADPGNLKKPCPRTEVVFRRTQNGYARIYFMKSSMSADVVANFFQHDYFKIDNAFELPVPIVQRLQLNERRVGAGCYKLRENKDYYIIDLDPATRVPGHF